MSIAWDRVTRTLSTKDRSVVLPAGQAVIFDVLWRADPGQYINSNEICERIHKAGFERARFWAPSTVNQSILYLKVKLLPFGIGVDAAKGWRGGYRMRLPGDEVAA